MLVTLMSGYKSSHSFLASLFTLVPSNFKIANFETENN